MINELIVEFQGRQVKVVYQDTYERNKTINFGFSGFVPTRTISPKELEEVHNQLLTYLGYPILEKVNPYPATHPLHVMIGIAEEDD